MTEPSDTPPGVATHFPTPRTAILLTFAAILLAGLVMGLFGSQPDISALGIAEVIGLGAVGSLAARRVPPPQAERLGLRGFDSRFVLPLLLLLPFVILTSELDNLSKALVPPPDGVDMAAVAREQLKEQGVFGTLQLAIVAVGLSPVVQEWLFRGVLQQGLVARMGMLRGVLLTSALFSLVHFAPASTGLGVAAVLLASLTKGMVLGAVRLATGSILPCVLLHASFNAIGLTGLIFADSIPIAGFNGPGAHTSLAILVPSLVAVYLGGRAILSEARAAPVAIPIAESAEDRA